MAISAGSEEIEFRYRPTLHYYAIWIFYISLAIGGTAMLLSIFLGRRKETR